jgi:hypothetical protein
MSLDFHPAFPFIAGGTIRVLLLATWRDLGYFIKVAAAVKA